MRSSPLPGIVWQALNNRNVVGIFLARPRDKMQDDDARPKGAMRHYHLNVQANPMKRSLLCPCLLAWCCFAPILGAQSASTENGDVRSAEVAKYKAETEKLNDEAAYYRKLPWITLFQYLVGIAAIATPLALGVRQLSEQRRSLMERAKVDASLKAAEIAMNAPTTGLVKARAIILSEMLKDFVPDFGKQVANIDHNKVGLGSWRERYLRLLDAISHDPAHSLLIVQAYARLFSDDDAPTRKKLADLIQYLEEHPATLEEKPSDTDGGACVG